MTIKRRDFLGTVAATGAASLSQSVPTFGSAAETTAAAVPRSTDPCGLVRLTDTIRCSRIGIGTGVKGGRRQSNMTRSGKDTAVRFLQFAYDKGVRLFDMADLYGTHAFLAEAMKGKPRDSYTIITKMWVGPGGLEEPERPPAETVIQRFLKELETDYIDLVQLHCMMRNDWAEQYKSYMDDLAKLKERGVIRGHGISIHAHSVLESVEQYPWIDAVHVRINQVGDKMDDKGTPANVMAITKKLHDKGCGTIAMKVLGEATPRFKDDPVLRKQSTEFVVKSGCFDTMVVGFEAEDHVTEFIDNVAAALKT